MTPKPTPQLVLEGKNTFQRHSAVSPPAGRVRTGLLVTEIQHWQLSEELISSVPLSPHLAPLRSPLARNWTLSYSRRSAGREEVS